MKPGFAARLAFAALLVLGGCSNVGGYTFVKQGVTQAEADQDLARCRYEAKLATVNYRSSSGTGSYSQAIGVGLAEGIGQAQAETGLLHECLRAKGYRPK